ncbi:type IV toxin-antitoxin system AbiEi family antitoxin [SAR92 clade bacterium H455]|uniref:Type IV toxin-antitoxin system AbiEi family antitoxin n=1 Tax=SAR92 clade bacterium H455 TaxID=2974818 RepID=A0ABY5TPH9_9GAMM|nr:type IV toxin-antitoxin system AbiEi family antitoxin [SAR92 clade bacterium H455]
MTTNNERKLNILLDSYKYGAVCLASWLEKKGISRDLQQYYCKSGWLEPVGRGAFKRPNDVIGWQEALQALVEQANLNVHVGAITALAQQGAGHYVRLGKEKVYLFSPLGVSLPAWFKNYDWGVDIEHVRTGFLPDKVALGLALSMKLDSANGLSSRMYSDSERAVLECLYLAPKRQDLVECYQVMEGLVNLRPKIVQGLLEACSSIKVKRMFLYMAEKANQQWLHYVDLSKVTLGKGDRSIVKNGVYIARYKITVPTELGAL